MALVYVSIGSNIQPEHHVCSCMQHLRNDFRDTVFSSIYQTPAEGFTGEPFLNLAAGFKTDSPLSNLRDYLKNLEIIHGRKHFQEKFSARTLDIDLLLYDNLNLLPNTRIPHPDITDYPFVLFPLAEIAPEVIHPLLQKSIRWIVTNTKLSSENLKQVRLNCT